MESLELALSLLSTSSKCSEDFLLLGDSELTEPLFLPFRSQIECERSEKDARKIEVILLVRCLLQSLLICLFVV